MKSIFFTSAATAILSTGAFAADIPVYEPAPVEPVVAAPATVWSGFYVGGHLGYGWSDFEFEDPRINFDDAFLFGLPLERDFDDDGILGGVQAGANAQFGSIVVGVEGDFSWIGAESEYRSSLDLGDVLGVSLYTEEGVSAELDWLSTFRGRLGFAFDRFMVYGTGGVAFGEVRAAGDAALYGMTDSGRVAGFLENFLNQDIDTGVAYKILGFEAEDDGEIHVGWTAGGGVEAMVTSRISARLEYLYADLGWMKHSGDGEVTSDIELIDDVADAIIGDAELEGEGDFKVDLHQVRVGLNVHF